MTSAGPLPRLLHPGAWWLWALGLATAASRTTNPLLLGLIVAVAGYVVAARRTDAPWARAYGVFLRLGLVVIAIRVVVRCAVRRASQGTTVLFTLPEVPLPDWASGRPARRPGHRREGRWPRVYDGLRLATMLICVGAANALANPTPAAALRAGRAVRGRRRGRGRADLRAAARRERRPGAGGPAAARPRRHAAARRCAASRCRCSRTRWSARSRSPRRWTPAATAGAGERHRARSGAHRRAHLGRAARGVRRACTACSTPAPRRCSGCRCCRRARRCWPGLALGGRRSACAHPLPARPVGLRRSGWSRSGRGRAPS